MKIYILEAIKNIKRNMTLAFLFMLLIVLFLIFSVSCDSQPKNENEPDENGIDNEEPNIEEPNETLENGETERFIPNNPNFYEELENDPLFEEFMEKIWAYQYNDFGGIEDFIPPDVDFKLSNTVQGYNGTLSRKNPKTIYFPFEDMVDENGAEINWIQFISFYVPRSNGEVTRELVIEYLEKRNEILNKNEAISEKEINEYINRDESLMTFDEQEAKEFFRSYADKLKSEEYGFTVTIDEENVLELTDGFYRYRIKVEKEHYMGMEKTVYLIWIYRTFVNQEYYDNINIAYALGIANF